MGTQFKIQALPVQEFEPLFGQTNEELERSGIRVFEVDSVPGYPCRVGLKDAPIGSEVLLLNYGHHSVDTPFRSLGPIFVERHAEVSCPAVGEVPNLLLNRILSVRGYDRTGMMVDADVVEGKTLESKIVDLFANSEVAYLHVHFAKQGCFACRVNRA